MAKKKKKLIKVLYVPTLSPSICWWRVENYAQTMVGFKKSCAMNVYYPTDPNDRIAWDNLVDKEGELPQLIRETLDAGMGFFDIVILQRIQNLPGLEYLKFLKEKYPDTKVIMELDDSLGELTPSNIQYDKFNQHMTISAYQMQLADAIIVSTHYLKRSLIDEKVEKEIVANHTEEEIKNVPIHVAPNCIRFTDWKHKEDAPERSDDIKNIVYCAGAGHDEDLMIAYKSLVELRKIRQDFKFTVRYGGFRPEWMLDFDWIDFKLSNWHISAYPQALKDLNADLALAPLRDTEFNRCKSNIKWQEWGSLNVPVVASNVEPYKNTKGFIILSSNDIDDFSWNISIGLDIDPDLTSDLRKQVKRYHRIQSECGSLLTFLHNLLK